MGIEIRIENVYVVALISQLPGPNPTEMQHTGNGAQMLCIGIFGDERVWR
jgi:hypothetical protein